MKGWRTILVVVLQAAVYLFGWEQLTEYLDPQYIALISTVLMLVLRMVTTTPVAKKSAALRASFGGPEGDGGGSGVPSGPRPR